MAQNFQQLYINCSNQTFVPAPGDRWLPRPVKGSGGGKHHVGLSAVDVTETATDVYTDIDITKLSDLP